MTKVGMRREPKTDASDDQVGKVPTGRYTVTPSQFGEIESSPLPYGGRDAAMRA
jgi:hypothetical protein